MTKEKIIDELFNALTGNRPKDDDFITYHPGLLAARLDKAYQDGINTLLTRKGSDVLDKFEKEEELTAVSGRLVLKKYHPCTLNDNEGIRAVFPKDNFSGALVYSTSTMNTFMDDIDGGQIGTYSYSGRTIKLRNAPEAKEWTVVLVPTFESLPMNEEIGLPEHQQFQIIEKTKAAILQSPPEDHINDSQDDDG